MLGGGGGDTVAKGARLPSGGRSMDLARPVPVGPAGQPGDRCLPQQALRGRGRRRDFQLVVHDSSGTRRACSLSRNQPTDEIQDRRTKEPTMPNADPRNPVQDCELPPAVTTVDDLYLADRLLHQLEQRYFGHGYSHPGFADADGGSAY
jgi:hypothetical protein